MKKLLIERGQVEDAAVILDLQRLAYLSEAEIYNNDSIPPLTQTLEQLRAEFDRQIFLKAILDRRIIGSVRACQAEEACHIGRLVVHPDFQNRGIGSRLMIENFNDRSPGKSRSGLFGEGQEVCFKLRIGGTSPLFFYRNPFGFLVLMLIPVQTKHRPANFYIHQR